MYAAGYQEDASSNYTATIWKNGVATTLTGSSVYSAAFSVFVSGTDEYVAGFVQTGTNEVATIWKNGVAISITDGSKEAIAYAIFVK